MSRDYDFPIKRYEYAMTVTTTKQTLSPTQFSITAAMTDKWMLVIAPATGDFLVSSLASPTVGEKHYSALGTEWSTEVFLTLGTSFKIWRDSGGDFDILAVAYAPTRRAL